MDYVVNTAMAIEDVAVGKLVCDRAVERRTGTMLPLLSTSPGGRLD